MFQEVEHREVITYNWILQVFYKEEPISNPQFATVELVSVGTNSMHIRLQEVREFSLLRSGDFTNVEIRAFDHSGNQMVGWEVRSPLSRSDKVVVLRDSR